MCCFLILSLVQVGEGQEPDTIPSKGKSKMNGQLCYTLLLGVRLYLPYEDRIIPDYSMIYASQFYATDQNKDGEDIVDALWCQSANDGDNIGVWYYPIGTVVPLSSRDFGHPQAPSESLFSKTFDGQIALARGSEEDLSGDEGLYKCIIPDENGVDQTLVVGAYTDTGYNNNGM